MTQGPSVTVQAGAKINPLLVVHGRRADGFHELTTLMLGLDLCDAVEVTAAASGGLRVESTGPHATPDIRTDATNLAARGAQVALDALGESAHLVIKLHKGIPSRAGLGGGSSDAAGAALAVLELLRPGWNGGDSRGLESEIVRGLGTIGADCAFFFAARRHGAALSTGRGERVAPLTATPPWHVALVTPAIECPTPAVYRALDLPLLEPGSLAGDEHEPLATELLAAGADVARRLVRNDLEEAALRAFPALGDWHSLLADLGLGHFRLAGSGSSFFGLFDDAPSAQAALDKLQVGARERGLGVRYSGVTQPSLDRLLHVAGSGSQ